MWKETGRPRSGQIADLRYNDKRKYNKICSTVNGEQKDIAT